MFPFIGIQADEEPKTAISASGLYNSSIFNVDAVFSSTILGGLSDFTIMNWFYISPPNPLNFYTQSYVEFGSSVNINPIRVFENKIDVSINNSNGGNIFITYPYTTPVDEWIHIAVTGSVTNNKVTLYINGVEVASTVMTYSIATGSTGGLISDTSYASRAQLNIYNRELTDVEVAEHYVYDDDTMTSGVLGWDAMTPAQKSGLIYSSSYTDDISISGNEFNDKSGSGITISPQPSLTGDQIYFYTDASDLPSDTQIYNVNSAHLSDNTKNFTATKSTEMSTELSQTWSFRVMIPDLSVKSIHQVWTLNYLNTSNSTLLYIQDDGAVLFANNPTVGSSSGLTINTSATGVIQDGVWANITINLNDTGKVVKVLVNNGEVINDTYSTRVGNNISYPLGIGTRRGDNVNNDMIGYITNWRMWNRSLSVSEMTENYKAMNSFNCYDSLSSTLLSGIQFDTIFGEYSGNNPTLDSTGNSTISQNGIVNYTDQGLTVECTS